MLRNLSPVGEEGTSATQAEEAVAHQHGAVIAHIPVLCDILVVHNQRQLVGQSLQHKAQYQPPSAFRFRWRLTNGDSRSWIQTARLRGTTTSNSAGQGSPQLQRPSATGAGIP